MKYYKNDIAELNAQLENKSAEEIIRFFIDGLGEKISFGTSFGAEDQVITHMIIQVSTKASIFTLDTGRLFPETYDLIDRTSRRYKKQIDVYFPNAAEVEEMVSNHGINLFYDSIELRKKCCHIRKLNPLSRALKGKEAWFTGLRKAQAVTRLDMQIVEWDDNSQMLKINPLINWSEAEVWEYIKQEKIPYNSLHDQGFPSIGCQACTRAIEKGEDIRAGRWWWENPETRECGLHKK
jgi:phosphoadenosine phosphosulfate reductase